MNILTKTMSRTTLKKYAFYLFRWQLSTPILAIVIWWLAGWNKITVTVIANLIGGLIFFWVDRIIFRTRYLKPLWEINDEVACADCGKICRGYRLVKTTNYDRFHDANPKFRCEACSDQKLKNLRAGGIKV